MGLRLGGTTERLRSIDRNNALNAHLPIGPNVTHVRGNVDRSKTAARWLAARLARGAGTHEAGAQHPPGLPARLEELDGVPEGHGGLGEGLQLADGQVPGRDPDGRGTPRKPIHTGKWKSGTISSNVAVCRVGSALVGLAVK